MRTITTKWVILNDFANSEFRLMASAHADCVVPENIHAPLHGRSLEIPKRGGSKAVISKGWRTTHKTLKATYERSEAPKHTYVHCYETKVGTPGHRDEL